MIEHKKSNGRREVPLETLCIDVGDELSEGQLVTSPDFLQAVPELILETDARLMSGEYDRPFDVSGFHSRDLQ